MTLRARSINAASLRLTQRARLTTGAAIGIVGGGVIALLAPWQLAVLVGWDLAAIVIAGTVWMFLPRLDSVGTRAAAMREDLSSGTDDLIIVAASMISLVGVVLTLVAATKITGALNAVMTIVAVLTVAISWVTVHTLFTLRYARLYYIDPEGGVDFPGNDQPDYLDFVYLSFTVGMTFQVSDTDISSRPIRRSITRHALLGYVFGTVIIGVTINVVGGLIG